MRALRHGTSLRDVIGMVKKLRERTQIPAVLFTYFNPVHSYGIERFGPDCRDAGVDGVLCVDLPPEEAGEYKASLDALDIATIFLLAPTSTDKRIETVSRHCTGFVYYVSRTGVTGEQARVGEDVRAMVAKIMQWENNLENYFATHQGARGGTSWQNPWTGCNCPIHGQLLAFLYSSNFLGESRMFEKPLFTGFLTFNRLVDPLADTRRILPNTRGPQGEPWRFILSSLPRHPLEATLYELSLIQICRFRRPTTW